MTRSNPMALCLAGCLGVAGPAHADIDPLSLALSQTLEHDSNPFHASSPAPDWLSITTLRAAVDEPVGRGALRASAQVDRHRHARQRAMDATGYAAQAELDWSTVGALSGVLDAEVARTPYVYGLNGILPSSSRALQTDRHGHARVQLGGAARWTLYADLDGRQRRLSSGELAALDENQSSVDAGVRLQPNGVSSLGLEARLARAHYPNLGAGQDATVRALDASTSLQLTGASLLTARGGLSHQRQAPAADQAFFEGALEGRWTSAAGGVVDLTLARDSDTDTGRPSTDLLPAAGLAGPSINTRARLSVTWPLTARIVLAADLQFARRQYDRIVPTGGLGAAGSGANRTTQFTGSVHYQPWRTMALGCAFRRERRHADASLAALTPGYSARSVWCTVRLGFQ